MNCPNCKKDVGQTVGKKPKVFCNSTCRSNFWQKNKRSAASKVQLQDLTKTTDTASIQPQGSAETNFEVNTIEKEESGLNDIEIAFLVEKAKFLKNKK